MADGTESYEIHLDGDAGSAVSQIIDILRQLRRENVTPEEALQRALGTELYLLQKVNQGAKVTVESKEGHVELDLAA
jgi:hypothetical protein